MLAKGGRGGGMTRGSTDDFRGSETTLYDMIMVNAFHYTFVKIFRM